MPVPNLITDLSTTAASNYPSGSDSPATLDDVQRAHAAFIAQIRDGTVAVAGTGLTGTASALSIGGNAATATSATSATSATNATNLTGSGTISDTSTINSVKVGYRDVPQLNQTPATAITIADAGKQIYASAAGTFTIPANSSQAFPVGAALTFINMNASACTIAITTDTLYLAGAGTTGSRTLAQYGVATALKITSTSWIISGGGLT